MSYTITVSEPNGPGFSVEVRPGPGAPKVTQVQRTTWDQEGPTGNGNFFALTVTLAASGSVSKSLRSFQFKFNALVKGSRRFASDGLDVRAGVAAPETFEVGTAWRADSQISDAFLTVSVL